MTQPKEKAGSRKFVGWQAHNHFEVRRIAAADWKSLGAAGTTKDTVWNKANGWRVPREEIPLTDQQLNDFLARDKRFWAFEA